MEEAALITDESEILEILDEIKEGYENGEDEVSFNYGTTIMYNSSVDLGGEDPIQVQIETDHYQQETRINPANGETYTEDHIYQQDGDFTSLRFEGVGSPGNHVIEIDVEADDYSLLYNYIYEDSIIEVEIVTELIEENEKNTFSSFIIDNGEVTGYFIEREAGTYAEERQDGSGKRIPAETYEVIENDCSLYDDKPPKEKRENCANEFRLKTTPEKSGTRSGILIHTGVDYEHTSGCLITAGDEYTSAEFELKDPETGETIKTINIYDTNGSSGTTLNSINTYIEQKQEEAEESNKALEINITINR
ncbi:hypothetical protein L21SP5_00165 [Salinivirga cyanobacteriivorans]|uniref:DUF5675 domain-containing protein n=1 Tax=Salinivirga cyanobacteriivorans TaxID=1307839 RepID=A0A0S2HUP0_9BACT|nr:hypothetical protein [Salinivirga cyanobacteriivorans]ALO13783.1 hypothetical protein L21SP5_00101 [Salinivirga cyanobacteriivorans]ALO13845.1 hypothetical protein L21SP5_00165 [Salinivirga cyanobacteriivorans]